MKAKAQTAKTGIGTQQKQASMFSFLMINWQIGQKVRQLQPT